MGELNIDPFEWKRDSNAQSQKKICAFKNSECALVYCEFWDNETAQCMFKYGIQILKDILVMSIGQRIAE